jgi:hypothetical protein
MSLAICNLHGPSWRVEYTPESGGIRAFFIFFVFVKPRSFPDGSFELEVLKLHDFGCVFCVHEQSFIQDTQSALNINRKPSTGKIQQQQEQGNCRLHKAIAGCKIQDTARLENTSPLKAQQAVEYIEY